MAGEFDMRRMQEEAVRRAREMQARARFPQQGRGRQGSQAPPEQERQEERRQTPEEPVPEAPPPQPPQEQAPPLAASPGGLAGSSPPSNGGLLENLFKDKEKTIILALLILLGSEEGDRNHELMFALLFLLI